MPAVPRLIRSWRPSALPSGPKPRSFRRALERALDLDGFYVASLSKMQRTVAQTLVPFSGIPQPRATTQTIQSNSTTSTALTWAPRGLRKFDSKISQLIKTFDNKQFQRAHDWLVNVFHESFSYAGGLLYAEHLLISNVSTVFLETIRKMKSKMNVS